MVRGRALIARFAIPGDPATPTGGYVYDARVAAVSDGALAPLRLPGGFPHPTDAELVETMALLRDAEGPLLIDGLAYGALPADLIAALPRPPVALCHHPLGMEAGLPSAEAARLLAMERTALSMAAHVIVTSDATKRTLVADMGLAEARIAVAPPGLDRAPPARGGATPPIILCVGSLTPRKGHDVLVGALARLTRHRPDLPWHADFVGPDDRAPDFAAALREQVAASGLLHRIRLLGPQSPQALDRLYDGADVFALASRYEGYGMVFAEAMMRALPVVASGAGAVADLVPAEAGTLCPVGDEDAFARALAAMLEDPAGRRMTGAKGRQHALRIPGWDRTWATIRRVLETHA